MKRRLFFLVGLAVFIATFGSGTGSARAGDAETASRFVGRATAEALTRLTEKGLSGAERMRTIRALVTRYISPETLSEAILGRAWSSASAEDKARFEGIFVDYVVALCDGMLKDIPADTKIVVKGVDPLGEGLLVVHSDVRGGGDGEATPVEWTVATAADGNLVLADVSAEGVSLVRTMRSDFRAVLFANGGHLDALMSVMTKKIQVVANAS